MPIAMAGKLSICLRSQELICLRLPTNLLILSLHQTFSEVLLSTMLTWVRETVAVSLPFTSLKPLEEMRAETSGILMAFGTVMQTKLMETSALSSISWKQTNGHSNLHPTTAISPLIKVSITIVIKVATVVKTLWETGATMSMAMVAHISLTQRILSASSWTSAGLTHSSLSLRLNSRKMVTLYLCLATVILTSSWLRIWSKEWPSQLPIGVLMITGCGKIVALQELAKKGISLTATWWSRLVLTMDTYSERNSIDFYI